ncbi:MAG: hypothetical protein AB7G39_13055 [Alphaproteobacteria bacterium]
MSRTYPLGDARDKPGWGFRIGSRQSAGAGHVVRSLAIAKAMHDRVTLFLDPDSPDSVFEAGFHAVVETGPNSCEALIRHAESGASRGIVLDSYALDTASFAECRRHGAVASFADIAAADGVDILVDPYGMLPPGEGILSGPAFAPLDARFRAVHARACTRDWPPAGDAPILVAFGQIDTPNLTGLTLSVLAETGTDRPVTVCLGARAPHLNSIRTQVDGMRNARLLVGVADMIPLYETSAFAIGAPGVSQFERACCGLPTILMPQNDTQRPIAQSLTASGLAASTESDPATLRACLEAWLQNPTEMAAIRASGLKKIDGSGAQRIAEALERHDDAHK